MSIPASAPSLRDHLVQSGPLDIWLAGQGYRVIWCVESAEPADGDSGEQVQQVYDLIARLDDNVFLGYRLGRHTDDSQDTYLRDAPYYVSVENGSSVATAVLNLDRDLRPEELALVPPLSLTELYDRSLHFYQLNRRFDISLGASVSQILNGAQRAGQIDWTKLQGEILAMLKGPHVPRFPGARTVDQPLASGFGERVNRVKPDDPFHDWSGPFWCIQQAIYALLEEAGHMNA